MAYVNDSSLKFYLNASDNTSGSATTWTDKSSAGNNAVLNNFSFNGTTSGWTPNGLAMDSVDDTVTFSSRNFALASQVSMEFYFTTVNGFKVTDTVGAAYFAFGDWSNITLYWLGSTQSIYLQVGGAYVPIANLNFAANETVHLIATYGNGTISLYKNGNLVGTNSCTNQFSQVETWFGINGANNASIVSPIIVKAARLYNKVLTSTEVTQNYTDATTSTTTTTKNLIGTIASVSSASASLSVVQNVIALTGSIGANSSMSGILTPSPSTVTQQPIVTKYPTTNSIVTTGWSSPTSAYSSTDSGASATAPLNAKNTTITSKFSGFDFSSIPTDNVQINSVTVSYKASYSVSATTITLSLQAFNGANSLNTTTNSSLTTTSTNYSYTLPITDVSQLANLSINASAQRGSGNTSTTVNLDYISIVVDYSTITYQDPNSINLTGGILLTTVSSASLTVIVNKFLTGSANVTVNNSASLLVTKPLDGTVTSSSQLSAILNVIQLSALSGSLVSTLGINATLSVTKELGSTIPLNSVINGSLVVAKNLVSNVNSISIVSGNLGSDRQINASIVMATIASANLNIGKPLTSNINIVSNVLSSLSTINNSNLTGSVASTISITANINKAVNLSGNIDIKPNLQSTLAGIIVALSGNVVAKIQVDSSIDKYVNLLGDTSSKSSVANNVTVIQIVSLEGNINSKSDIQTSVFLIKNLGGQVITNTSTQAYMNLTEIIYAELYIRMVNKYDLDMMLVNEHELDTEYIDEYDLNMVYSKSSEYNMKL